MKQYNLSLDPDEMWLIVEALLCISGPVGSAELVKKHPQIDIVGASKGMASITDKLITCMKSLPFEEAIKDSDEETLKSEAMESFREACKEFTEACQAMLKKDLDNKSEFGMKDDEA